MKVYMTYEFSDYGLWDTKSSKIFAKLEDAEAYSKQYGKEHGWLLDITEFEVEETFNQNKQYENNNRNRFNYLYNRR